MNCAQTLLPFAMVGSLCVAVAAQEGSEAIELTVYNQGIGLVKDVRTLDLQDGRQTIRFTDVAALIDPTSVHFSALADPESVAILEQNYQFDLVDSARLLSKYLGKEITIVRYDESGKVVSRDKATLLSTSGPSVGVAQVGDKIVLNPAGTVELPELPEGLIVKPTLLWDLVTKKAGPTKCEVSYITQGLSWTADYVLVVNVTDSGGDMNGWVTLTNGSGATYKDAKLKLIAGDVAVAQPPMPQMRAMAGPAGGAGPQGMVEKPFFEYHMYTLPRTTTVADRETKQVLLMSAPGIKLKKLYIFDPTEAWRFSGQDPDKKVAVKLEVKNSEDQGLGMPLPKGRVRVFRADDEGSLQFIGEDNIDHTPRDETVRLYVGNAFDLVGELTQTNHEVLGDRANRDTYRVSLRNHKKDEAVSITHVAHTWGDWKITQATAEWAKKDAYTAEFTVDVPADGETEFTYTIERRW